MQRLTHCVLLLALFCACEQKAAPSVAPSASAAAATPDFAKMNKRQRLAVAAEPCYTDKTCDPGRTRQLLAAAEPSERAELERAIRKALADQFQTSLAKKHGTVARVAVSNGVVNVTGVCNKFVLENFLATPGRHAKHAGLKSVKCESKAMQAEAQIP